MTTEMRMLEQLVCSDMQFPLMAAMFPSIKHAQRAILGFHTDGVVEILDAEMVPLPAWRVAELCRMSNAEWSAAIQALWMRLTSSGLKKYRL